MRFDSAKNPSQPETQNKQLNTYSPLGLFGQCAHESGNTDSFPECYRYLYKMHTLADSEKDQLCRKKRIARLPKRRQFFNRLFGKKFVRTADISQRIGIKKNLHGLGLKDIGEFSDKSHIRGGKRRVLAGPGTQNRIKTPRLRVN